MLTCLQRVERPWLVELEAVRRGWLFNRLDVFWPDPMAEQTVWPAYSPVVVEYGQVVKDDAETPLVNYRGFMCFTQNS